jgi:hypothetical protein
MKSVFEPSKRALHPMTDHSEQATPVPGTNLAKFAGWASLANIVSWLLLAIPVFLESLLGWLTILTIVLSAVIALAAGILGLVKGKAEARAVGQCVMGIFVGALNIALIIFMIVVISGMRNIW